MTITPKNTLQLAWFPVVTGLIPILGINVALLVAILDGDVQCIPYWEGCTSVSGVGRAEPSKWIFRGVMLPYTMILAAYWILTYVWLKTLLTRTTFSSLLISGLGILSALFLVLHLSHLGEAGELSHKMRRIGVNGNLFLGFFAQCGLTAQLFKAKKPIIERRSKLVICLVLLGFGLASIPVADLEENKRFWQNIIAWNFFLVSYVYFLFSASSWRSTGFRVKFSNVADQE
ncbi:MAG: hypothetical protein AAF438_09440 [Pseudomonadota bacterium]